MFFDSHMWGFALGWAFVTALVSTVLVFLGDDSNGKKASTWTFFGTFAVDLLIMRAMVYYIEPSFVGSFGGYWAPLFASTLCVFLAAGIAAKCDTGVGKALTAGVLAVAALIIVPSGQYIFNAWGTANAREFAKLPNITVADVKENLPPTDQNHIVMVTQAYASYKGSSVITTGGNNLGSIFKTVQDDYTLQSVAGHLYWIAPLVYTNFWSQVGFLGTKFADSPGFVSVDAEDPNADAVLHLKDPKGNDYHIRYLPDAYFMQNLLRYVYLNGYTDGNLEDPTLEVDDNWMPFYTVTYIKPAFGDIAGQKMDKVLLVNAQTGEITPYEPSKTPDWVDRVMSYDLVKEYASDWGDWHDPNSTWPNWNSQYQMQPLELEFHYNSVDKPVWVIPFVNRNGNQNAAAGILVFDTHDNKGTFYPGLSGKNVGETVKSNFHDTPKNANGRLTTASVQLYTISGVPTWVAIYVNSNGQFGGIGMLDAREPNVSNVQLEANKDAVVRAYKNYLAGMSADRGGIAGAGTPGVAAGGHIARISPPVVMNNTVTFFFTLTEDPAHSFTVTLDKYSDLPLLHPGDQVTFEFIDTKEHQEPVSKFGSASQR